MDVARIYFFILAWYIYLYQRYVKWVKIMRLRNVSGSEELIAGSRYVCNKPLVYKGNWNRYFKNANPIYIEIGMGKGKFITEMARLNPDVNFIGIEKYSSVLYRAVKKLERVSPDFDNLVFLCLDARELKTIFCKGEVSRIYLNFSDPWPKDRHARRRITYRDFLAVYDEILAGNGRIEFKTDNEKLFHFSLAELEAVGWKIEAISYDLHEDTRMSAGNVMTEYEEKFSGMGKAIFKVVSSKSESKIPAVQNAVLAVLAGMEVDMVFNITNDNFQSEVLESELPVLVDFYADWCGPCNMLMPIITQLAKEYDGRFKIGKCNIEEEMELANSYRVMSIPTLLLFKDGELVKTYVGAMTKEELVEMLEEWYL